MTSSLTGNYDEKKHALDSEFIVITTSPIFPSSFMLNLFDLMMQGIN